MNTFETGPEAKRRLILESASKGEFELKLCERHYFAHVEGCNECVVQTASEFFEFLETLPEEIDAELDILDNSIQALDKLVSHQAKGR